MLWVAVMQTFNKRELYLKEIDDLNSSLNSVNSSEKSFSSTLPLSISTRGDHEEEEEDEFERKRNSLRNGVSPAAYHFARIFSTPLSQPLFQPLPISASTISLPISRPFLSTPSPSILPSFLPLPVPSLRFTVILGGSVRTDKFRALDYLINTVRTTIQWLTSIQFIRIPNFCVIFSSSLFSLFSFFKKKINFSFQNLRRALSAKILSFFSILFWSPFIYIGIF